MSDSNNKAPESLNESAETVDNSADEYNTFVDGNDSWENIEVPDDIEASSENSSQSESSDDDWDEIEVPDEESEVEANSKESKENPDTEEKTEEIIKESKSEPEAEKVEEKPLEITNETIKDKTFKVKVDGEHVELTGQELINKASGNLAIEKRLGELDKEKKEFYSEKSAVEQYIAEFGAKVKDGNVLGGLEYFGQFAGLPPYLLKEQLIAALKPEIESRSYMTEEEIRNYKLKAENDYLAQKTESDAKRMAEEQAQRAELEAQKEFESHINSLKETHSITEQEWDLAFTQLDQEIPEGEPITPDMVVEKANKVRVEEQTSNRVKNLIKDYEGQLNDEYISLLKKVAMENPDYSDEDLNTVIEESLRLHKKNAIKDKLDKKLSKTKQKSASVEDEDEFDLSEYLEEDGW